MVTFSAYLPLLLAVTNTSVLGADKQSFLESGLSAQEFLQKTSPDVVLSAEYPSPELHSAWYVLMCTTLRINQCIHSNHQLAKGRNGRIHLTEFIRAPKRVL